LKLGLTPCPQHDFLERRVFNDIREVHVQAEQKAFLQVGMPESRIAW
jgi:hypothetical protein